MLAVVTGKIAKKYEAKGGDYENQPGSKNKAKKGAPEHKGEAGKLTAASHFKLSLKSALCFDCVHLYDADKKEDTKATSSKRKKADEPTEEKADGNSEACVAVQLMEASKSSQC